MTPPISILIADDDEEVRAGYRELLSSQADMTVVAEASDGFAAFHIAGEVRPDLVIMDLNMPRMGGIEATRRITGRGVGVRVLVLTVFDQPEDVEAAIVAGASGFLLKNAPVQDVLRAIRAVHGGGGMLSPEVTTSLIDRVRDSVVGERAQGIEDELGPVVGVTEGEAELLRLIAHGRTNEEIAAELYLAMSSVKTYVSRLRKKLNARTRAELVALYYAGRNGTADRPGSDRRAGPSRVPTLADRRRRGHR